MSNPRALLRRQVQAFHLAGTVTFPSPFPEVGTLSLLPGGLAYQGVKGEEGHADLVVIEHVQSNRVTVTRHVLLDDVAAVVFSPGDRSCECWYFGPEIAAALEARSSHHGGPQACGIAYVRESAAVLMTVEVGMTAAESAEYYPPVIGERTDAHYASDPCCCNGCDGQKRWAKRLKGCNGGCDGKPAW